MRFFGESSLPSISEIQAAIAVFGPEYAISSDEPFTLSYSGRDIATLELSFPGEETFEEEIEEFMEALNGPFIKRHKVAKCLKKCKGILCVEALFGGGECDEILDLIAPLWQFLAQRTKGLIQADGEGFYSGTNLILKHE